MNEFIRYTYLLLLFAILSSNQYANAEHHADRNIGCPGNIWPAFRGNGTSVTQAKDLPLHWSDDEGLAWKVGLPGYGQSSPVVWNDRVFVTTMQGDEKETPTVLCFDLASGKELWKKEYTSSQQITASNYVTRSAPTPVVDANSVYAFFESGELLALSHDGELQWQRSLVKEYGEFQGNHGVGSSLAADADRVFVLVNHGGPSYLLAANKGDGKNAWKVDYEKRVAWSSPTVSEQGVIVSASGTVNCYSHATGEVLWQFDELDDNNVPSPTVVGSHIYVGAKDSQSNLALAVSRTADSPKTVQVAWRASKASCSFNSPLVHQGKAYLANKSGAAFAVDSKTGELLWKERLPASCWASPVAAGDRIYFFTKAGKTIVASAGDTFEQLAENSLSTDSATKVYGVAAVNGSLLIRTGTSLYCVRTP